MPIVTAFYLLLFKNLLLANYISFANGKQVSQQQIQFDLDYGGLHTMSCQFYIRFGTFFKTPEENNCIINNYTGCFDVMLSTIHPRTFLLDGRPGKCEKQIGENEKNYSNATILSNFCKTHPKRFNPDHSLTMRGEPIKITNPIDGREIGIRVEDYLQFDYDLKVDWQKFEIMNHRAATLPDYWGIEAGKDNLADGCLSLMAGELMEKDPDSFNAKKPVQRFVNYGLIGSIVTIQLSQYEEIWKNGKKLFGEITFGALSSSWSCNGWNFLENDPDINGSTSSATYWSFKINSIEGLKNVTGQNAIIDTTTQIIGVPWAHWDAMQNYFFDNNKGIVTSAGNGDGLPRFNCADANLNKLKKMRAFRFSTNNLWYTIPSIALVKQINENECQILIGKNAEQSDQRWHFGVPFLRSHCVAKEFDTYGRMWFSGGVRSEDLPKSNANATFLSNLMIWIWSTFITLNFSFNYISKFLN